MTNSTNNPFFAMDFSKMAEMMKMQSPMGGMNMGAMSMEPLMAMTRRNIEAATAVNQAAYESLQVLARRQSELMRQGIEDAANMMSAMMSSPASPEEKMMKQAEASKAAVEKCMANAREVAETISKCNTQTMEVVTNRLSESLEELRGMMKPRQQNAA